MREVPCHGARDVVLVARLDAVGDPIGAAARDRRRIPQRASLHRAGAAAVAERHPLFGAIARPEDQIDRAQAVVVAGGVPDLDRARRRQLQPIGGTEDFDPRRRVGLDDQVVAAVLAHGTSKGGCSQKR